MKEKLYCGFLKTCFQIKGIRLLVSCYFPWLALLNLESGGFFINFAVDITN